MTEQKETSAEQYEEAGQLIGTQLLSRGTMLLTGNKPATAGLTPDPKANVKSSAGLINSMLSRFPDRFVWAAFMFINGFVVIGIFAALSKVFRVPFVFPSLGASAFLFFFTPDLPGASPRNAVCGHAIGILSGYSALLLFGLASEPSAAAAGINGTRVLAIAFSLALAGALMIVFKTGHPPAGATALIVSLGIVSKPIHLLVLELAVIMLALQAIAINRMAGIDYPLWRRTPKDGDGKRMWSPEKAAAASSAAAVSWGAFMFLNGFITIGILTGVAMVLKIPFIFPSLGATAFLLFFCPGLPSASPRNAVCGNAVSVLAGFIALNIFGLGGITQITAAADAQHVLASAFALALAGLLMILLKVPHPPAAATALIVTLGLVTKPLYLLVIVAAVALLALQAIGINRLAYIDYPLWQKK